MVVALGTIDGSLPGKTGGKPTFAAGQALGLQFVGLIGKSQASQFGGKRPGITTRTAIKTIAQRGRGSGYRGPLS